MQTASEAAVATTNFLAKHSIAADIQPLPEDLFTEAHGDKIYGKIQEVLKDAPSNLRIQALKVLNSLMKRDDGNIYKAIDYGAYTELVISLDNEVDEVRQLASLGLAHASSCRYGREHTIKENIFEPLTTLLSDSVTQVRANTYIVLQNLASGVEGINAMINFGFVDTFIVKLKSEEDCIKSPLLDVLCLCLQNPNGYEKSKAVHTVRFLTEELQRLSGGADQQGDADIVASIRTRVCRCLAACAFNFDGKDACVSAGTVLELSILADSEVDSIRKESCSAISQITNSLSGKIAVLTLDQANKLLRVLLNNTTDKIEDVCVSSLQAIANTSEHPDFIKVAGDLMNDDTWRKLKDMATIGRTALIQRSAKCVINKVQQEAHMVKLENCVMQ